MGIYQDSAEGSWSGTSQVPGFEYCRKSKEILKINLHIVVGWCQVILPAKYTFQDNKVPQEKSKFESGIHSKPI